MSPAVQNERAVLVLKKAQDASKVQGARSPIW
jgi:hypothetical protein